MTWQALSIEELQSLLSSDLAECSEQEQWLFSKSQIVPARWRLSPWGDAGGGFWAVAVLEDRVLWYNDIEEGFNVSRFVASGRIPNSEYWCNQDSLRDALRLLRGESGLRLGPPEPVREL